MIPRRLPTALLAVLLATSAALAGSASAQETPLGAPQPDKSVRDPEFGVVARHLGLERRVEMLQWQAAPDGYVKTWSDQPIDSSRFAPGHRNPGDFPLQSRRWLAKTVNADGKPLDQEVIRQLAQWHDIRPSFAALPGNLSATFQPEGNGLGSAENPLDPQVGDLHIHWRDLMLPALDGRVALHDGRWQLLPPEPAVSDLVGMSEVPPGLPSRRVWFWIFAGLLVAGLLALGIAASVQRKR